MLFWKTIKRMPTFLPIDVYVEMCLEKLYDILCNDGD